MEIKSNIPFTGNADLSGLKIDRSIKESNLDSGKGTRRLFTLGIPLILIAGAVVAISRTVLDSPVSVKAVTAIKQSVSQTDAMLAASGYVVAQRKAAVASKATEDLSTSGSSKAIKLKRAKLSRGLKTAT